MEVTGGGDVCWSGMSVCLGCGWVDEWILDKFHSLFANRPYSLQAGVQCA